MGYRSCLDYKGRIEYLENERGYSEKTVINRPYGYYKLVRTDFLLLLCKRQNRGMGEMIQFLYLDFF